MRKKIWWSSACGFWDTRASGQTRIEADTLITIHIAPSLGEVTRVLANNEHAAGVLRQFLLGVSAQWCGAYSTENKSLIKSTEFSRVQRRRTLTQLYLPLAGPRRLWEYARTTSSRKILSIDLIMIIVIIFFVQEDCASIGLICVIIGWVNSDWWITFITHFICFGIEGKLSD